jgi:hypothetical protein
MQCFPGFGSVAASKMPMVPLEPPFPLASSSPKHLFDSNFLNGPLDIQSAHETTENPFFAPHGILSSNTPPRLTFPTDELNISATSTSTSVLPAPTPPIPHAMTYDAPKWRKIPQVTYDQGGKQWYFKRVESIVFEVDGHPGVNMADALRDRFTGLKNRDDFVLQDGRQAFSCRLQVGLSFMSHPFKS